MGGVIVCIFLTYKAKVSVAHVISRLRLERSSHGSSPLCHTLTMPEHDHIQDRVQGSLIALRVSHEWMLLRVLRAQKMLQA